MGRTPSSVNSVAPILRNPALRALYAVGDNATVTITDERRLVTVLFADLVGFTGRAEQSDPEAVREFQRAYFATIATEVERFGGVVEKYIGDAAMALFGAPTAHDDDAERALRTALSIREALARMDGGLEVRIGVNTGEVVGGTVRPAAGRLHRLWGRGERGCPPPAGGRAERDPGGRHDPPAQRRGIRVRAARDRWRSRAERSRWRSGAWSASSPSGPRSATARRVWWGANASWARSSRPSRRRAEGRGLMVALAGEPGIGKSRLALEIRRNAEANGFTSAWTSSRSYASAFPYHLVRPARAAAARPQATAATPPTACARQTSRRTTTKLERWAAVLDDVLGEGETDDPQLADLSPSGRQRILVHAIGGLLRSVSERKPMLLVLDDLHWADPASLAVVEELLDVLPGLRVMLLVTYRSNWSHGWEGRSAYEQLNLRALRAEDARRMAVELAQGALAVRRADRAPARALGRQPALPRGAAPRRARGQRAAIRAGCRRRSTRCCWRGWMPCRQTRAARSSWPR